MSRWIPTAGRLLRFAAALGLCGIAGRFGIANVERVLAADHAGKNGVVYTDATPFVTGKAPKGAAVPLPLASALSLAQTPPLPTDLQQLGLPPAASAGLPAGEGLGSARQNAGPSLVRMALVVSAGPPRSEVYVNGSRKGHTPFIGDMTCRQSDPVRVDIVPPSGMPLTFKRPCGPGTLSLR